MYHGSFITSNSFHVDRGYIVGNKAEGRFSKRVVSGGKKCSFFGKFDVLGFLETLVLRIAHLPYYRRIYMSVILEIFLWDLQIKMPIWNIDFLTLCKS